MWWSCTSWTQPRCWQQWQLKSRLCSVKGSTLNLAATRLKQRLAAWQYIMQLMSNWCSSCQPRHMSTRLCAVQCVWVRSFLGHCVHTGVVLHIDTPVVLAAVAAEGQKGGAINARPQHNWQPVTCGHGWVLHSRCLLTLCGLLCACWVVLYMLDAL